MPLNLEDLLLAHWSPSATAQALVDDLLPALGQQTQAHLEVDPVSDFPATPSEINEMDDRFEGAYDRAREEVSRSWKAAGEADHERWAEGVQLCENEMTTAMAGAAGHHSVLTEVVQEWMAFTHSLLAVGRARYRGAWRSQPDWAEVTWLRQRKQTFWDAVLDHVLPEALPQVGPADVMDWGVLYQQVRARASRHPAGDLDRLRPWLDSLMAWGDTLGQPGATWSCQSPRKLGLCMDKVVFALADDRGARAHRLDHEASDANQKAWAEARQGAEPATAWQAWLLERGVPEHPVALRDWSVVIHAIAAEKGSAQQQWAMLEDAMGSAALDRWLAEPTALEGATPEEVVNRLNGQKLHGLAASLAQRRLAQQRAEAAPESPAAVRPRPRARP